LYCVKSHVNASAASGVVPLAPIAATRDDVEATAAAAVIAAATAYSHGFSLLPVMIAFFVWPGSRPALILDS
jgi:hypothetical protein